MKTSSAGESGGRDAHARGAFWWLALALLLLNDHVLKGRGLLPGWLTGKLSDFAGLIVAPVLVAAAVGARSPRARAAAFAPVLLLFTAIKVAPAAAQALEAAMTWVGLPWRVWCDRTDLVALVVVPLAWRLARAQRPAPGGRPPLLPLILGSVACLATSRAPVGYVTSTYLVNMTLEPVEVRVYRAQGPLDCVALGEYAPAVPPVPFAPSHCASLGPGHVLPLDQSWSYLRTSHARPAGAPRPDPPCDAVIVRAPGLADTLLVWHMAEAGETDSELDQLWALDERAVYLEPAGDRLVLGSAGRIGAAPATVTVPEVACSAFPEQVEVPR